jgi:hypothetical protein
MITPSFSLTATERILPKLALDFTTASLDNRVTFTRSGNTATVTNSSGYIAAINADLPRFDYSSTTLLCKGLLIEQASTNNFTRSNEFNDNIAWSKTRTSIATESVTSPDGSATVLKLVEDTTASSTHNLVQSPIVVSGTSYTYSIYVKAAGRSNFRLQLSATAFPATLFALFDVGTGVITSTSVGLESSISNFGNGWYRCSVSATANASALTAVILFLADSGGSVAYTGNGTSGLYLYGAQFEPLIFPTSYIPTVATTVTRNADVAVMTSTNFSSWYTATTGAAVVWAIPQTATGTRPLIQFDDTTANEIIVLGGNAANPEMSIVDGGVAQAQIDTGTIVANTAYKLSGAWNTNNCAAAKDGGSVSTDVAATIPTPPQLRIGSDGTNYASAWVQKILYYPQRIIDAEVQAFSK